MILSIQHQHDTSIFHIFGRHSIGSIIIAGSSANMGLSPALPVQRPVLHSFGNVLHTDQIASPSVILNPVNCKVHKFPLIHQAKFSIAEHSLLYCIRPLECFADLNEIFAVNKERFIRFP